MSRNGVEQLAIELLAVFLAATAEIPDLSLEGQERPQGR
jgi:hypothetical protein